MITAAILNDSTEVIKIGNIQTLVTITIYENGTRTVDNQRGALLTLESGQDEGQALIVNRLYANGTLITEINNVPTFAFYPDGTHTLIVNGQEVEQRNQNRVPWFALFQQILFFIQIIFQILFVQLVEENLSLIDLEQIFLCRQLTFIIW